MFDIDATGAPQWLPSIPLGTWASYGKRPPIETHNHYTPTNNWELCPNTIQQLQVLFLDSVSLIWQDSK